jgi:D-glycero-D-manno-heptose 1,7-bisphosphate phosphatase
MKKACVRALFLDRDGVINHDEGYTSRIENFHFIEGIFDLCRTANELGYLIIVITNQAGIGRGYYTEEEFLLLTEWMSERFQENGVSITEVFFCPYHPESNISHYRTQSFDRKPNPGMILKAAKKYDICLHDSIMIGDKDSDMVAANRAGVGVRCHFVGQCDPSTSISASATNLIYSLAEAIYLLDKINCIQIVSPNPCN